MVDVRDGGPPRHALQNPAKARALRDACLGIFPRPVQPLVPSLDRISQRWLMRSCSPYVHEIEHIADALDISGVWLLNASMQWGCTSLACEQDGSPWLLRTLDWPFHGLGRHTELAHMSGEAGDFVSVTWPGYVGVLTAMAPQRFAACINQAPMWRRTRHRWLRPYDFAANAVTVWSGDGRMPPDQLLRQAFEVCADYETARRMLETTPLSRSVIYTLVGCAARERCVIERTEDRFYHPRRRDQRRQRLGAVPTGLGRPDRHPPISGVLLPRGGGCQPRASRVARGMEWRPGGRPVRLGAPAGAQSVHAARGLHESRRAESCAPSATI